jgi:hypothetical protein
VPLDPNGIVWYYEWNKGDDILIYSWHEKQILQVNPLKTEGKRILRKFKKVI